VIPETTTAKATMKEMNGLLNARLAKSPAPPAWGYLVTSSA